MPCFLTQATNKNSPLFLGASMRFKSFIASLLTFSQILSLLALPTFAAEKKLDLTENPTSVEDLAPEVRKLIERARGQSDFANVENNNYGRRRFSARAAGGGLESVALASTADSNVSAERRDEKEADVFAIGPQGSRILYLLNDSRGLQAVRYSEDGKTASIVGRVQATGNNPENMYIHNGRLLVLERDREKSDYQNESSRVLVYDITDPAKPTFKQAIDIAGTVSDSRILGDVLYIAHSMKVDRNQWQYREMDSDWIGKLTSFDVSDAKKDVVALDTYQLPFGVDSYQARDNMGITQVQVENGWKAYLTAILSESRWGWSDRQSLVELVDISDERTGKIHPVMTVSAKGRVGKRGWVRIKDRTLLVASNYFVNKEGQLQKRWERDSIGKVAVETFTFPESDSEVLTEQEATYRKLHFERRFKNESKELSWKQQDALKDTLITDAELGVKGRFVGVTTRGLGLKDNSVEYKRLRKLYADSEKSVGDTTGQSAVLQDVRITGDTLSAFWVPQDKNDPYELFDISNVRQGIKHIHQLLIPGWITRSEHFLYKDRHFVVGLGYEVAAVDNDRSTRRPKAMLFEIEKLKNGKVRQMDLANFVLSEEGAHGNFDQREKYLDIRFNPEMGKGTLLFELSAYSKGKWLEGAKLVSFDLKQADEDAEKVFAEAGLMEGSTGWLKRVFTNPDLAKVNTFSNSALATYDLPSLDEKLDASAIVKASHILELARNIRGYVALVPSEGGKEKGVQLISDHFWSRFWWFGPSSETPESTLLRVVDSSKADAERDQSVEKRLEGTLIGYTTGNTTAVAAIPKKSVEMATELYVITSTQKEIKTADGDSQKVEQFLGRRYGRRNFETEYHLYSVKLSKTETIAATELVKWSEEYAQDDYMAYGTLEADDGLATVASAPAEVAAAPEPKRILPVHVDGYKSKLSKFSLEGQPYLLLSDTNGGAFVFKLGEGKAEVKKLVATSSAGVDMKTIDTLTLLEISGLTQPYVSFSQTLNLKDGSAKPVSDEDDFNDTYNKVSVSRNYIAPLVLGVDGEWSLGKATNIPGKPLAMLSNDRILVDDSQLKDMSVGPHPYRAEETMLKVTQQNFLSVLEFVGAKAYLKDYVPSANISVGELKALKEQIIYVKNDSNAQLRRYGGMRRNYHDNAEAKIAGIGFDANGQFEFSLKDIRGLELKGQVSLIKVQEVPGKPGRYLGILSNSAEAQVISWSEKDMKPRVVKVHSVQEDMSISKDTKGTFKLPAGGYWQIESENVHFNVATQSFEIPAGNSGVCQIYLSKGKLK
jgi:hypothetical protein